MKLTDWLDDLARRGADLRVVCTGDENPEDRYVTSIAADRIQYDGIAIKSAIPIDGGRRCILLLDPDANQHAEFENLLCIDQNGATVWVAKLPASQDAFISMDSKDEGVWASTWSGFRMLFDTHSGFELQRTFVK